MHDQPSATGLRAGLTVVARSRLKRERLLRRPRGAESLWITDGDNHSAFLTTRDGVGLFDAPPTIGHNIQRAVDEIAAANGVSNKVTRRRRLGTREDAALHQQYMADLDANCRTALTTVDPTPHFQKYGENNWAAVKSYLDAVTDAAAAAVIAKYTGVLGAAGVFTISNTFAILESIRLDHGYGSWIHP